MFQCACARINGAPCSIAHIHKKPELAAQYANTYAIKQGWEHDPRYPDPAPIVEVPPYDTGIVPGDLLGKRVTVLEDQVSHADFNR